tara:strand:+ start:986 stop:1147 length:162 start_codon:yes stop_codon:yes gene_type:complete
MARKDKYTEAELANITTIQSKKTARLKARRKRNVKLREDGVKFAKTDACYNAA